MNYFTGDTTFGWTVAGTSSMEDVTAIEAPLVARTGSRNGLCPWLGKADRTMGDFVVAAIDCEVRQERYWLLEFRLPFPWPGKSKTTRGLHGWGDCEVR